MMNTQLLDKAFGKDHIKKIKGFDYVGAEVVAARLDEACGKFNWDFVVESNDILIDEEEVVVFGKLGMKDPETGDWVYKSQVGGAQMMYRKGTDHVPANRIELNKRIKAAYSDCLKKCATLWGVARHLYGEVEEYDEEGNLVEPEGPGQQSPEITRDTLAHIGNGEATLKKDFGIDPMRLRKEEFQVTALDGLCEADGVKYYQKLRALYKAEKDRREKGDADQS